MFTVSNVGSIHSVQAMLSLACVLLLIVGVAASKDVCGKATLSCEKKWLEAGEDTTDDAGLCRLAQDYRGCLEDTVKKKLCGSVDVPQQLEMEESIYCNMPADIRRMESPCSAAQRQCKARWEAGRVGKVRPEEHCELAQQWLACVRATVANYLCVDSGEYTDQLDMELQVNCIGGSTECVVRQTTCAEEFTKAQKKAYAKRMKCSAARQYRECLVETVRSGACVESVRFPVTIDKNEAKYCEDFKPRRSCTTQANACRFEWKRSTLGLTSLPHRCIQARKWVNCLECIIQDGGCLGGYTVDVDAQVERAMSCQVEYNLDLSECELEMSRCWKRYEIQRKYQPDDEHHCNNVLQAMGCMKALIRDNFRCPNYTQLPGELTLAEVEFCPGKYIRQCKERTEVCEDTFTKTTKGVFIPSKICKAAKDWRYCIQKATTKYCVLKYPTRLEDAEKQCFIPDPTPCEVHVKKCRTVYSDPAFSKTDICDRAQKWRHCLDNLRDKCTFQYPMELNDIQAMNYCI